MDWKLSLSRMTGNYSTLDKKVLAMKNSWDELERLLNAKGPRNKSKPEETENKK